MRLLLILHPHKVILNALQDDFGFAFPKFPVNPFFGMSVLFAVIAGLARWHDIVGRIAASAIYGDVMLLLQLLMLIEERWAFAAINTSPMPVIQCQNPVFSGKRCGQILFLHLSALARYAPKFRVFHRPSLVGRTYQVRPFQTANTFAPEYFIVLPNAILAILFEYLVFVINIINSLALAHSIRVSFPVFALLKTTILARPLRMLPLPLFNLLHVTRSAATVYAIFAAFVLNKLMLVKRFSASETNANDRQGDVQHSVPLSLFHLYALAEDVDCLYSGSYSLASNPNFIAKTGRLQLCK